MRPSNSGCFFVCRFVFSSSAFLPDVVFFGRDLGNAAQLLHCLVLVEKTTRLGFIEGGGPETASPSGEGQVSRAAVHI